MDTNNIIGRRTCKDKGILYASSGEPVFRYQAVSQYDREDNPAEEVCTDLVQATENDDEVSTENNGNVYDNVDYTNVQNEVEDEDEDEDE